MSKEWQIDLKKYIFKQKKSNICMKMDLLRVFNFFMLEWLTRNYWMVFCLIAFCYKIS